MKKHRHFFIWIAGTLLVLFSMGAQAQNPAYNCNIANATQVSCNVFEFDVILKRTGTTVFKLAEFQCGIKVNPAMIPTGGVVNVAMVPGSSQLTNPAQIPTTDHFIYDALNHFIKIAPMSPVGSATSSTISNGISGTKLCRVRVACTLPFVVGQRDSLSWCFLYPQDGGYPTKIFAYAGSPVQNVDITVQASHTLTANANIAFTATFSAPTPQTVTSDILQVCQLPGMGALISLGGTQLNYTYYLYVNGAPVGGYGGIIYGTGSAASFTDLPASGVVSVVSPSCSGSVNMLNNITLTPLTPLDATVNVAASPGTSVPPGTQVTFTATPVNGGTTPSYVWYVNTTADTTTGPVFHYTPLDGDVIHVEMTSSETCVTPAIAQSNALVMFVFPVAYDVTLNGSSSILSGSYCQGTGGLTVGLDSSDLNVTYTLLKGGVPLVPTVTVTGTGFPISFGNQLAGVYTVTGNNTAGTVPMTGTATITETPSVPVSVSIGVDLNNLCSPVPVTFTATPVNGGSSPVYQWYLNGSPVGLNQATYTNPVPANGDVVHVTLTSNVVCGTGSPATSGNITIAILPALPSSVSISANQNNVCQGTTVNFTSAPVNGGTTPSYQWFVNGSQVSTSANFSYQPANLDSVWVVMTSSYACVTGSPYTSNKIHMIVNTPVVVSVTATPNQNNICSGTPVTFTAVPVNGGTPLYMWYKNGINVQTGSSATYANSNFANGDSVWVVMSSSLNCNTGNPVLSSHTIMHVTPSLPLSATISGPGGDIPANHWCINDSVHYTALPINVGTTPTYVWKLNSVTQSSTTTSYTFPGSPIVITDTLKFIVTSNLQCVTGSPYTVTKLLFIDACTGIEELSDNSSVIVYPNPTNDRLYVNFGDLKETPKSMKVYNTLGQLCFQTDQPLLVNQKGIDVANMSTGTYILQIVFENDIVTKHFIVR